jgi:hypothetical protein
MENMFGLLKTKILTNDFSKLISKPTENNTSPKKTSLLMPFREIFSEQHST